jgi:hypothetical protein
MQFTNEIEQNDQLNFLDVTINRINDTFSTSVFRKPTFTGLGLNYFSFTPSIFKVNSVKTLIDRAFNVSSTYAHFHTEVERLKTYFLNNLYPLHLVESTISDFLNKKYFHKKVSSAPKLKKYVKLPFFGPNSYKIRNELLRTLRNLYNHVDFQIIMTNPYTIGSFFKIKDNIPDDVRSCVVYEYQCSSCNARYIGSTIRSFKARRAEHFGKSILTGRPLTKPSFSSVRLHSEECDHPLLEQNFKILRSFPNQQTLLIAESIFIKNKKPSLNNNTYSVELYTVK